MSTKSAKKQESKGNNMFKISGKAFWAHVTEPNKLSNKFQLDLSIDDETARFLESKGIETKINDKDDEGKPENHRGTYVTLKSEYPPKLYDAKAKEIKSKILVGNGSDVYIATHVYDWKFGRDTGTSLGLDGIQIINLVPFRDSVGDMFEETMGYEAEEASFEDTTGERGSESRTPELSKNNPF